MLRFALVVPSTRYSNGQLWSILPSRGLLSLAAVLQKCGHDVAYIDADIDQLTHADVAARIDAFGAQVVGVTMNTFQYQAAADLAKALKKHNPDLRILVGGPHPSALRGQVLEDCPWFDIACCGEGEETVVELAQVLDNQGDLSTVAGIYYWDAGQLRETAARRPVPDLDSLPFPALELAGDLSRYPGAQPTLKSPSMHLMASRGCPYRCTFCSKSVFGSTVRFRSPQNIVNEMEWLHTRFGINEIFCQDDTMNVNRRWFFSVCDEIISRGLHERIAIKAPFRVNKNLLDEELLQKAKQAGFWMIFYGVESGNQEVLNTMKKGTTLEEIRRAFRLTHAAGINTIAAFMVGNVGDTPETVQDSVTLAKEIRPTVFGFSVATPLPGTEFHAIAQQNGWIRSEDFREYSEFQAVSRNAAMTCAEISALRDRAADEVTQYLHAHDSKQRDGRRWESHQGVPAPFFLRLARKLGRLVQSSRV
jgi:radical SAM superfamily enzyme YgiQ (UPF0313 family)